MSEEPGLFDSPSSRTTATTGGGSLSDATHAAAPLAVRMRPRDLDELVGQSQLRAQGSPLRQLVEGDQSLSLLLWGPPGTGKTLMAEAVAGETGKPFVFVDPGAFINMFMGVGILKVKSLFRKLRKLA